MEIQKQISKTIETVSKENLWHLVTDAYITSGAQIILGYGIKSIVLYGKCVHLLWVSLMSQAYKLWVQLIMVLSLILLSEAAGSMLRSSLGFLGKERIWPLGCERQFGTAVKAQAPVPA